MSKKNQIIIVIVVVVASIFMAFPRESNENPLEGWGHDTLYVTSDPTTATTSIAACKISHYHKYPTSTDLQLTAWWWCATTTTSTAGALLGSPDILADENTGRQDFAMICSDAIYFWLANTTTSDMNVGELQGAANMGVPKSSTGWKLAAQTEWKMSRDFGMIWPGHIYALASSSTSTCRTWEW